MVILSKVQNCVLLCDEDEHANFIANNVENVVCASFCTKTLEIFHHIESINLFLFSSIVWFKSVDSVYFPTYICISLEPSKLMEF